MSLVRKLGTDRNMTGAIVPLSLLPIFGITALLFGLSTGLLVMAFLVWAFALFYLYVVLRTGNLPHLFVCAYATFLGSMIALLSIYAGANRQEPKEWALAYFTGLVFFGVILIYLVASRRLKWRGREVLELAAEPVEDTGNGYTSRPRPVGRVEYSPQEITAFSRFCARHLIALPYVTSKNITLVPIQMGDEYGRLLGLSGDYRDATWVNFDVSGEVSVHIAQKDYLEYREPLAFDQLCASLGQLFIDFLELHSKGQGIRIINRMDDLKIPVLS